MECPYCKSSDVVSETQMYFAGHQCQQCRHEWIERFEIDGNIGTDDRETRRADA